MCSCAHDFPLMSRPIARGLEAMTNSSFITKLYETFNGTQTLLGESVMQRAEHGSKAERGGARRSEAEACCASQALLPPGAMPGW